MTERELFEQQIPQIAKIVTYVMEMSEETYADWKAEVIEGTEGEVTEFMEKIFILIEFYLSKERQVQ